jgi:hypothetical protein
LEGGLKGEQNSKLCEPNLSIDQKKMLMMINKECKTLRGRLLMQEGEFGLLKAKVASLTTDNLAFRAEIRMLKADYL